MFDIHVIHPAGAVWIPIAINMVLGGGLGILAGESARNLRGRSGTGMAILLNFLAGGSAHTLSAFFNVGQFPVTFIVTLLVSTLPSFLFDILRPRPAPPILPSR